MKRLAIIALLLANGTALAEPNTVAYQLQERCGKRAEEVFHREQGSNPTGTFQAHYNSRLNKCFSTQSSVYDKGFSRVLIDVNESKEYGYFLYTYEKVSNRNVLACYVAGLDSFGITSAKMGVAGCDSEMEWEGLTAPYMEDR